MLKFIRYAFAAFFFAASVGCLALWWRSSIHKDTVIVGLVTQDNLLGFRSSTDRGSVHLIPARFSPKFSWQYRKENVKQWDRNSTTQFVKSHGHFVVTPYDDDGAEVYFPLWYPALLFALAGVGILRFRRQFSIGSALISLTVVAALLGMIVAL